MSTAEKEQIRQRMQEKDTEELLDIWTNNDRGEWTNLAFEVVREILVKRVGELPAQHLPASDLPELDDYDEPEEVATTYHSLAHIGIIAGIALKLSWLF